MRNLGHIINQIGFKDTQKTPSLIGVAEIENAFVLQELINSEHLKHTNYKFVHFDSNDERGIDTALLYDADCFEILEKKVHEVYLEKEAGVQDYTRDILYVKGKLDGIIVHVLVNHWPSRRAGVKLTEPQRIIASKTNIKIINSIRKVNTSAKIIVLGDFNDDPESNSIKAISNTSMYNPMELLLTREDGSLTFKGEWNLFDQIIISQNFLQGYGNNFRFKEAKIFDFHAAQVFEGVYKGHPFRTYAGPEYLGGISDHFPIYGVFTIHN